MQKSGDTDFSSSRPFSPNIQKTSAVCQAMIWNRISASISRFLCVCSYLPIYLVVVQLLSHVWLFATPWASLFFTISWSLPKLASTELVMPSDHLILCCPLLLLPSMFPSIRVFSKSRLFVSDGQSIGASASVLLMNIQGWFPLGLTDFISVLFKGLCPRVKWSDLYVVF